MRQPLVSQLNTREWGSGDDVVVLVHGFVVSSRYFAFVGEKLGLHRHVYAPDLPGFGKSPKRKHALSTAELADALIEFADGLNATSLTLLGQSYGAQICAAALVKRPDLAQRLILLGPTLDRRSTNGAIVIGRWLFSALWGHLVDVPIMLKDLRDFGLRRAFETFGNMRRDDLMSNLRHCSMPTLVLRGEHDFVAPFTWCNAIASAMEDAKVEVIKRAGHDVHVADAHRTAQAIERFLQ